MPKKQFTSPLVVAAVIIMVIVIGLLSQIGQTGAQTIPLSSLSGRLSYDGTTYKLTVGESVTPPCCYYSSSCVINFALVLYTLDFSRVTVKPTVADNGKLITVVGTQNAATVPTNIPSFVVSS